MHTSSEDEGVAIEYIYIYIYIRMAYITFTAEICICEDASIMVTKHQAWIRFVMKILYELSGGAFHPLVPDGAVPK